MSLTPSQLAGGRGSGGRGMPIGPVTPGPLTSPTLTIIEGTFSVSKDTALIEDNATYNADGDPVDVRGLSGSNRHGIVSFGDVSGTFEATDLVIEAYLRCYVSSVFTAYGTNRVQVHVLTRDFTEAQATWNVYSTGNNWTSAGGDYDNSNGRTLAIPAPTAAGWWNVPIAPTIARIVATQNTLCAILLRAENESGGDAFIRIANDASSTPMSLFVRALRFAAA